MEPSSKKFKSYIKDVKSISSKVRANSLKGMDFQPFPMAFYHGGIIKYVNGAIKGDNSTSSFTIPALHEMRYEEFEKLVFEHSGIDMVIFRLRITLYFEYRGKPKSSPIMSDETLNLMFFLAKKDPGYCAQLHVERVDVPFDELAELWTFEEIRGFLFRKR